MSMLNFGVILVSFAFNTVVAFGLCLVEFSKVFIKFLQEMIMFSRDSFKVSLYCDFLRCMCSFISLKEV
jgi:hypothetical protein